MSLQQELETTQSTIVELLIQLRERPEDAEELWGRLAHAQARQDSLMRRLLERVGELEGTK